MKLVVDAEVIFASLIARGFTLQLVKVLSDLDIELLSPEYVFEEINKRKDKILKFSGLNDIQFHFVINIIFENIKTVKIEEYVEYMEEAKNLAPHERDIPYFALALAKNCAIWSNEKAFKKTKSKGFLN